MNRKLCVLVLCFLFANSISFGQGKPDVVSNTILKGKPFVFRPERTSQSSGKSTSSLKDMVQLKKEDDLKLVSEKTDKQGFHQQKYQQYNKGIPVEYGRVSVSANQGIIRSISGEVYDIPENVGSTPSITERTAIDTALKHIGANRYAWESEDMPLKHKKNSKVGSLPKGELVYVSVYLQSGTRKKGEIVLAYKFDIYAIEPLSRNFVFVDAHQGGVIHKNAIIKHAEDGTAHTRFSSTRSISTTLDASLNKYVLKDDSRGLGIETYNLNSDSDYNAATSFTDSDNNWTAAEFDNTKKDNVALDAHWGAQKTYDYFKEKHGRNSYDDNGAKIKSYVHYGVDYVNAFWNGSVMTYGDGDATVNPLTSLDICAHEIGHAVCESTANLVYFAQSGALNESLSDIWAATIEHYVAPEKSTWELGEDINFIIRSMSNPNEHEQPDTYEGNFWYTGFGDNGGVHYNSGVMNHWYYILVTGKNGVNDHGINYSVEGIGFDAAASIVYRMESVYLTPNSQYEDARNAAIYAATDIFGAESNEVNQTRKAWTAVGLYETMYAPSQLTAAVVSPTSVNLSWKDNASTETSFMIQRSLSFNSGFETIKTLEANTITYTDTDITSGIYYYRVRAIIDDNSTESSNKATAATGVSALIMSATETSVCNKVFLDPGGFGNYTGGENFITMVIHPAEAGKKLNVSFSSFALSETEWYLDGLQIFDGTNTSAPLIGTYIRTNIPPNALATNPEGALTFRFISEDTNGFGWQAYLSCEAVPDPPSNLTASALEAQVNLTWTDNASIETGYRIERKNSSKYAVFEVIAIVPANTTSYADPALTRDLYYYKVTALKDNLYSASSNSAEATIGTPFIMSDGTHTICSTQFLDPGGYGPYPISKRTITTLAPAEPGTSVTVSFHEFDVVSFYDYLLIYDGGSVDAPLLGQLFGRLTSIPYVVSASNPEGKLTFEFVSDGYSRPGEYGWRADVNCYTQPAAPTNLLVTPTGADQVRLTWTDNASDETGYVIERKTGDTFTKLSTINANMQAYDDVNLQIDRQYTYRVRALREIDGSYYNRAKIYSPFSNTDLVTLGTQPVSMKNGQVTACDNSFFDSGVDEKYANNENYVLTINPNTPGDKVMVGFTSFDLEDGYDSLWIYDGENTSAPLLGVYTGNTIPPSATASNPDGKLTFRFFSDLGITAAGWEASVFCGTPLVAPDNLTAQTIGNDQINLTWEDHEPSETGYIVERATGNLYVAIATLNPNTESYQDTDLLENRKYIYRVRAVRNGVTSEPSTAFAIIGTAPVIMHHGTVTACNTVFLDPGGDEHHGYGNQTLTIGPDEPGKQLTVTFTKFDFSEWYYPDNYLEVFNGPDTSPENSLGKVMDDDYRPDNLIFQSTNPEGKLTFKFQSVNGVLKAGWEATINCATKSQPEIVLPNRTELYFDYGVSYYRGQSYKGARFTYEIVDDGTNTGELRLDSVPEAEQNWIGLFTLSPGKVKIKASIPETEYYQAAEKISTITIIKRTPIIIFSSLEAAFGSESLTLNARDYYGGNINFRYEIVNDRNNTAEVQLSGPGNRVVTFLKAGVVKIKVSVVEDNYYSPAEKTITLSIRKEVPTVSFTDIVASYGSDPFDLNATAYGSANVIYSIVGGNTGSVSLSGPGNRTVTPVLPGTVTIKAFLPETQSYFSSEKNATLTIIKANQVIDFGQLPNVFNNALPFSLAATASSGLPVSFTIKSGPATVLNTLLSLTGELGVVIVEGQQFGNDNYHPAEPLTRSFSVVQDPVLSAEDDLIHNSTKVWPNPATGAINIKSEVKIVSLSLFDVLGKKVIQAAPAETEFQLDVRALHQGIYLLYIKTENNSSTAKRLQIMR